MRKKKPRNKRRYMLICLQTNATLTLLARIVKDFVPASYLTLIQRFWERKSRHV